MGMYITKLLDVIYKDKNRCIELLEIKVRLEAFKQVTRLCENKQ